MLITLRNTRAFFDYTMCIRKSKSQTEIVFGHTNRCAVIQCVYCTTIDSVLCNVKCDSKNTRGIGAHGVLFSAPRWPKPSVKRKTENYVHTT